jgi:hypothetical protein
VALTSATSAVTPLRPPPRPYDAPVLEMLRPGSRRLLAGVTVASGTLLAAACGSSDRSASDVSGAPSLVTAPSSGPATTAAPAATTALDGAVAPAPAAAPPPTAAPTAAAASANCAARAAHTFLHVTAARAAADGSLTLTANPARLVCGAGADSHFALVPAAVTAHVIGGASITVFPGSSMRPEPIAPARLPAYLASDQDTRTFLVTGPLRAISGLDEQSRP